MCAGADTTPIDTQTTDLSHDNTPVASEDELSSEAAADEAATSPAPTWSDLPQLSSIFGLKHLEAATEQKSTSWAAAMFKSFVCSLQQQVQHAVMQCYRQHLANGFAWSDTAMHTVAQLPQRLQALALLKGHDHGACLNTTALHDNRPCLAPLTLPTLGPQAHMEHSVAW